MLKDKGSIPDGYFIIFNEIAGMMVDLINAGLAINQHTVPDGSVGSCWARHWNGTGLGASFGVRVECEHYYPDDFLQAKSNPQIINAYPDGALSEFRRWFKHEYLTTKFPPYILKKSKVLPGGAEDANRLIEAFKQSALESK